MLLLAVCHIVRQAALGIPRRSRSPSRFQPLVLSSPLECKTAIQKLQVVGSPVQWRDVKATPAVLADDAVNR
jgi:hypothetical protein